MGWDAEVPSVIQDLSPQADIGTAEVFQHGGDVQSKLVEGHEVDARPREACKEVASFSRCVL